MTGAGLQMIIVQVSVFDPRFEQTVVLFLVLSLLFLSVIIVSTSLYNENIICNKLSTVENRHTILR